MGRTVKISMEVEYEDEVDVDPEDEHLTDEQLHDKYVDEASDLLKEAVEHGWHDVTSVDVKVETSDA